MLRSPKAFNWLFREFLKRRNAYIFRRLGLKEKTIYSWQFEEDVPHYRRDPITRALEVLDVIFNSEPDLGVKALKEFCQYFGFDIEPMNFKGREVKLSETNKELHDVVQAYIEAMEDGKFTAEELNRLIKEIREAETVLGQLKAHLMNLLKQKMGV